MKYLMFVSTFLLCMMTIKCQRTQPASDFDMKPGQTSKAKFDARNASRSVNASNSMTFNNGQPVLLQRGISRNRPRDCQDLRKRGKKKTGVYRVFPEYSGSSFDVRCDMDTDGGGWTVFQRRTSGKINFYQPWRWYQVGFGDKRGDHWLGLQQLHLLSAQGWYKLRVDMEDNSGAKSYAVYNVFSVGNGKSGYVLYVDGYHGNAGDSFSYHSGSKFTTKDRDNDVWSYNCAQKFHGAWWYRSCHNSNLNGLYGSTTYGKGLNWNTFSGYYKSLKFSEMKMRKFLSD